MGRAGGWRGGTDDSDGCCGDAHARRLCLPGRSQPSVLLTWTSLASTPSSYQLQFVACKLRRHTRNPAAAVIV